MQRVNYVTPTCYLELIKTFKELLDKKRLEILSLRERYVNGADKLESSEKSIITMQKMLHHLQPKMIKTSIETEDLINAIEREAAEVDIFKHNVEADKERANKSAMEAQAMKGMLIICRYI